MKHPRASFGQAGHTRRRALLASETPQGGAHFIFAKSSQGWTSSRTHTVRDHIFVCILLHQHNLACEQRAHTQVKWHTVYVKCDVSVSVSVR